MKLSFRFVAKFTFWTIFTYWAVGIYLGYLSAESNLIATGRQYSKYIGSSTALLVFALFIFSLVSILDLYVLQSKTYNTVVKNSSVKASKIAMYGTSLLLAVGYTYFYLRTGFVPALQLNTGLGAKYFADIQDLYLPLRPLYTFLINFSTSYFTVLLYYVFFLSHSRVQKFHVLVNIGFVLLLLVLTLKRGPILLPVSYMLVLSYWFGKFGIGRLFLYFLTLSLFAVMFWVVSYGSSENILGRIYASLVNSFFVFNREFSRFLESYDGELIWGLSYIAAFTSFIPTSLNEIKDLYLFPRFSLWQEGVDANLSGGPRNSFVAEAYANFGLIGVYAISCAFALVVSRFSRVVAILPLGYLGRSFKPLLLVLFLQQGILAFLENGSAAVFHLGSKAVFIVLIVSIIFVRNSECEGKTL